MTAVRRIPCAKVLGGAAAAAKAFRPASIVNISGMSFGSLSGTAVEALNRGAAIAGCLQNTGEGGVSPHHLKGGDLDLADRHRLLRLPRRRRPLQHAEAQGYRRRRPRSKRSRSSSARARSRASAACCRGEDHPEIAAIRGVPMDRDCISPARHTRVPRRRRACSTSSS